MKHLILLLALGTSLAAQMSITTVSLGPAEVGDQVALSVASAVSGGTSPYTWKVSGGMLPGGLILTPRGALVGILTTPEDAHFTLTATDSSGISATGAVAFTVVNPPIGTRIVNSQKGTGLLWTARAAFAAAQFGDYVSTVKCVELPNHACSEANPILLAAGINPATAQGRDYFMWTKIGITLGVIGFQEAVLRPVFHVSPDKLALGTLLGAVVQGGVDWHNTHLTQQIKAAQAGAAIAP